MKTHFANIQPDGGLPHNIPKEFTEKAIYIVRDPRSVVLSISRFFQFPIETAVEVMTRKDFTIGDGKEYASCLVSSWTNHVASWVSEKNFPVHIVKYEDMMDDAGKELTEVLQFLEQEVDPELVTVAIKTSEIANLKKEEADNGF